MFAFLFGVTTIIIIFILLLFYINQFSTDSEFRKLIDENNVFNLKNQDDYGKHETFKREISLKDETINWINALFTQIFTHFRGDSENSDIECLNKAITDTLPPGFSFKLDTIGKDIIFSQPKLFYIQESNPNPTISNSNEDKEILQVKVPAIYNGLSFTILSQIDRKNCNNLPIQIPLFEFDFRRFETNICVSFSFENQNKTDDAEPSNDFKLNVSFELEKESGVLDFDSSLIMNRRKFTFTNCPIIGDFIKKLLQYLMARKKFNFLISSPMINYNAVRNFIEKQNIIRTELNLN